MVCIRIRFLRKRTGRTVGNRDPIDLHAVTKLDDKVWNAVNEFCLHQIRAVRIDLDHHIRSFDFKGSCIGYIGSKQGRRVSRSRIELPVKLLQIFFLCATSLQKLLHIRLVQPQRFRLILMLLNHLGQIVMQRFDRVKIAGIPKRITDQILEGGFLISGRHRHMTSKDIVNQIILKFLRVFGII